MSTPWAATLGQIAYVEAPLCLFTLATLAIAQWVVDEDAPSSRRRGLLAGLFGGAAAAVKYTGVVYVALPLGGLFLVRAVRRRLGWGEVAATLAGGVLVFGPWLLKNTLETGNPVYPLAYSVFGGIDLDAEWALRWHAAHAAEVPWSQPVAIPGDLVATLRDVALDSPLQSALLVVFVPLGAVAAARKTRGGWVTIAAAAWIFLVYWLATHRIDRFWLPMLPPLCLLAARGLVDLMVRSGWLEDHVNAKSPAASSRSGSAEPLRPAAQVVVAVLVVAGLLLNLLLLISPATGPSDVLAEYERQFAAARPAIAAALDEFAVPPAGDRDGRVLLVGEADVLLMTARPVYATVFDQSRLHRLTGSNPNGASSEDRPAPPEEVCRRLQAADVTLVVCNWAEVLRYRTTYGTTDYDSRRTVMQLVADGVLEPVAPPSPPQQWLASWASLDDAQRREAAAIGLPRLAPAAVGAEATGDLWPRVEFFRVRCATGTDEAASPASTSRP